MWPQLRASKRIPEIFVGVASALIWVSTSASCYRSPDPFVEAGEDAATDSAVDAATDADPDADAGPDAACTNACIDANTLLTCPNIETVCTYGCSETNGAHCRTLTLRNQLDGALVAGLGDLLHTCVETLQFSEQGLIADGTTVLRAAGDGVINGIGFGTILGVPVYAVENLHLESCKVQLKGGRSLAIAVRNAVRLDGVRVYGGGEGAVSTMPIGCADGSANSNGAGGGAGGGTSGGFGSGPVQGAPGGPCSPMHSPLRTGSTGGISTGFGNTPMYGYGGMGGAALQISARGAVEIVKSLFAFGGAGGGKGNATSPAGGGGSGGTIFFEGRTVDIANSYLYANGGNGGYLESDGAAGIEGTGPASSFGGEGRGGTGGYIPGNGTFFAGTHTGGGGAVGHIRVHALQATVVGTDASPIIVESTLSLN